MNPDEIFKPPQQFAEQASISSMDEYRRMYAAAQADPEGFWAEQARNLHWFAPWSKVLDWSNPPFAKWFVDGKINAAYNCIDRHAQSWRRNKAAIIWEGEDFEQRMLTYGELYRRVCKLANALKGLGLRSGARAIIYMPMVPEAAIAMLACARLGITHSVVYFGFSAEALRARVQDLQADLVITADGATRRGREMLLKQNVDEALTTCPNVKHVLVHKHVGAMLAMKGGRDHWWEDLTFGIAETCPCEALDSEHPLFVIYTSGTTGQPKGILHTTGGYLTQVVSTMKWVFDIREDDMFWTTADVDTIVGHSYMVYGALAVGATTMIYEGAPDWPKPDRVWRLIEKNRVSVFYTSPMDVRFFLRQGEQWPEAHDLSSLRLLGSVGEPLNSALWKWLHRVVGKQRCPIVDTWFQTETGAIMIAPLPGATPLKAGSVTQPLPGVTADVVNENGVSLPSGKGYLVLKQPWPAMLRAIYQDQERFRHDYWTRLPGNYFTGDAAWRDNDGYFWVLGRVDDVISVGGHRVSTAELESVLVHHDVVSGAAVVAAPHELKGQAVHAFVTLRSDVQASDAIAELLSDWLAQKIGPLARPERVHFVPALPTTKSGKIMRRLLRELVINHSISGDATALEEFGVLMELSQKARGI
jgi:acetyl-CoA synthetase